MHGASGGSTRVIGLKRAVFSGSAMANHVFVPSLWR